MTMRTANEILEQRARLLAQRQEEQTHHSLGTYAVVQIGERLIGVSVSDLREIVKAPSIARLPNLPAWICGLARVQGELLSVIDLAKLYRVAPATEVRFVAVVCAPAGQLGLLADRVIDFREITTEELCEGRADPALDSGFPSRGTTRDLVTLLDVEQLFCDERVVVDHATHHHETIEKRENVESEVTP